MSTNSPTISKPRSKRTAVACELCHRRRIKCDGATSGLPCSNCKKAREHVHCQLIRSRRARGTSGRFAAVNQDADILETTIADTASVRQQSTVPSEHATAQKRPRSDSQQSEYNIDLTRLCRINSGPASARDRGSYPEASPFAETPTTTINEEFVCETTSSPGATNNKQHAGESWYVSYVLQQTNNVSNRVCSSIPINQQNENGIQSNIQQNANTPEKLHPDLDKNLDHDELIYAYFDRFHKFCPIIDKKTFLDSLAKETVPGTLLRSVLFIGAIHVDTKSVHRLGFDSRLDAQEVLFKKAKLAVDNDDEDRMTMVICSYLLHYWWGRPTTTRDSLWWLAGAVRVAQGLDMHRSAVGNGLDETIQRQRRRIWWNIYLRDRQVSFSVGKPFLIHDDDCDAEELSIDDFPDESLETATHIIYQVKLAKAVSHIMTSHFRPSQQVCDGCDARRQAITTTLEQWRSTLPDSLRYSSRRGSNVLALNIQIVYHYYLLSLHQMARRFCVPDCVATADRFLLHDAATSVTRLVEDLTLNWEACQFPMIIVSAVFSAMIVQYVELQSADEGNKAILQHNMRANLLALKVFEKCYALAGWLRGLFMKVLESHEDKSIARPVRATIVLDRVDGHDEHQDVGSSDSAPHTVLNMEPNTGVQGGVTSCLDGYINFINSPGAELWHFDFPSPESTQFQSLQYLADLGTSASGSADALWDLLYVNSGTI